MLKYVSKSLKKVMLGMWFDDENELFDSECM